MRKYVLYLLMGIFLCGNLNAKEIEEKFLFGNLINPATWVFNVQNQWRITRMILFPTYSERFQWIIDSQRTDYNYEARCSWTLREDLSEGFTEGISMTFFNSIKEFGKTFKSFDDFLDKKAQLEAKEKEKYQPIITTNLRTGEVTKSTFTPTPKKFKKLSDFEGIIEIMESNYKEIRLILLHENWIVTLKYRVGSKETKKWDSWEEHRDFWLNRFALVFNQIKEK